MSPEEERLMLPSFVFPDADTSAGSIDGEKNKKAPQQRRRRKAAGERGGKEEAKKRRLSDEQAQFLEMRFREERKLETPRKVQLASELGLDTKQVAVWFQNRRARYKSKLMEEEFSKLRAAHDAVVLHNCHLETELLKLKQRLGEAEEENSKLVTAATAAVTGSGAGGSSPSSSSFSTVTHHPALEFGMGEAETDLTYINEYAYNYMLDWAMAPGGYLGGLYVDDQFS